jgi:lipopolysaccharide export system protein LptC
MHPVIRPVVGLLRVAWDRLSLYLPVILMGLLALGTYLLVRSAPVFMPPEPDRPATHEPDYFMKNFSVKTFDPTGRLKSEVTGADARHFPDTDTLEIDQVRIRSFNEQGQLTIATANRAVSNADGSEVQLFGNALVVRDATDDKAGKSSPRLEFRGEFLHAYMKTEQVKSDKPVQLVRGKDRFTGDTMDFDNLGRVMQLRGRVKGLMVPEPSR